MKDLGTLGGSTSIGYGINDAGDVVGVADTKDQGASHAFLYTRAKGMVDLNSLIPSNSGWFLTFAYDVNDSGQITGVGSSPNGGWHAFLLSPARR